MLSPSDESRVIPDHYIVVLKQQHNVAGNTMLSKVKNLPSHKQWLSEQVLLLNSKLPSISTMTFEEDAHPLLPGLKRFVRNYVRHWYEDLIGDLVALNAYAGVFAPELVDAIREKPDVAYVERDQVMRIMDGAKQKRGLKASYEPLSQKNQAKSMGPNMMEAVFGDANGLKGAYELLKRLFDSKQPSEDDPYAYYHLTKKDALEANLADSVGWQMGAPWGLSRLPHKHAPDGLGLTPLPYTYPRSAGKGVTVYVIDTGIDVGLTEEFGGRAKWGITIPRGDQDVDGNGHGTHCAGIVGSKSYGVAKEASLVAVKVLSTEGYGSNADVIAGVAWTIRDHLSRRCSSGEQASSSWWWRRLFPDNKNKKAGDGPYGNLSSVVNMSLGGGRSYALEAIVENAIRAGIHFAVAAGNDAEDACDYSPAACPGPITVGASTSADDMAFFSNHGSCVDVFAPGLNIKSTWTRYKPSDRISPPKKHKTHDDNERSYPTKTISGTSMASPHIAGVIALYLGTDSLQPGTQWTPKTLRQVILADAHAGILSKLPPLTPNKLASTKNLLNALKNADEQPVFLKRNECNVVEHPSLNRRSRHS